MSLKERILRGLERELKLSSKNESKVFYSALIAAVKETKDTDIETLIESLPVLKECMW